MSTTTRNPAKRSRLLDWKSEARILADSPKSEPTKPTNPLSEPCPGGSVGFVGATPAISAKIEEPAQADIDRASGILNRAGVRIMQPEGVTTIGVWSDLEGPEVRAALRTLEMNRLPVRFLDGADIPMRYKLRRVEGEPVPKSVLAGMERNPAEPWKVRDRMLNEMDWCPKGKPGREPAFPF